jgi:hypothetical protein
MFKPEKDTSREEETWASVARRFMRAWIKEKKRRKEKELTMHIEIAIFGTRYPKPGGFLLY